MPSVATAGTSSDDPPVTVEQAIDDWLERSLPRAEQVGHIPGVSMFDPSVGNTPEIALHIVADLLKSTAASRGSTLKIEVLPAETLPDAIGQMLHGLQKLSLCLTSLTSLPESLGQLGELRHLEVGNSPNLKTLPSSLTRLPKLNTLQLSMLPLKKLPDDLGNLQSLRDLTLIGGEYTRLPASVTQLSQLYQLTLKSKCLQQLPEDIGKLQQLRSLTLRSKSLERLPDSLTQLKELKELTLSSNSILTQLPENIGQLNKLEKLDLASNLELAQLPQTIGQLSGLKELSLRNCKNLMDLPDSLGDLSQLKLLDLTDTGMRTLPQCLARLPADCEIRVPLHMKIQLHRIRHPEAARAQEQAAENRRAVRLRSQLEQATASWNRVPQFKSALERIEPKNPALVECFDKWTRAIAQNARNYGRAMTPSDMPLLDKVVAHAIQSSSFRSVFEDFLRDHTNKRVNVDDGMTRVGGGGLTVFGDVRTAFSKMLEHKLMHMDEQVKLPVEPPVGQVDELRKLNEERKQALRALQQEEALKLLQEAIKDLGMSRRDLLQSTNELTGKRQMWPPLRAYVSVHDLEGRAAVESAYALGNASSEDAEKGVTTEEEVLQVYKQEEARANATIDERAKVLVDREWGIQ
ncbi:leucine-rich repeat domain-containing protein [Xanthomonas fragariae]|uniref:leucine-rich repeat domain-containing protein n=1 Tax=Xanthomonas fragariae TaxID=48664 RepID=UPI003D2F840E